MDIDDTRADLIDHVAEWSGVAGQLRVRMTDGTESWIDIRSPLADELYLHPELGSKARAGRTIGAAIAAVRKAAKAEDQVREQVDQAREQVDQAVRAALDAGATQDAVAVALGITARGLRKRLSAAQP